MITFTLLTIRQHLVLIPDNFADVKAKGHASIHLSGQKRQGWQYTQDHREVLFAAISKAVELGDVVACMDVLLLVPNLGLVKAGFIAQMLGMEAGCIDTHNENRFGLSYQKHCRFRKSPTMKPETKQKKIRNYLALCKQLGGARHLWNSWCAYVANPAAREARFQVGLFASLRTPSDVSRFHVLGCGLSPVYEAAEIPF